MVYRDRDGYICNLARAFWSSSDSGKTWTATSLGIGNLVQGDKAGN